MLVVCFVMFSNHAYKKQIAAVSEKLNPSHSKWGTQPNTQQIKRKWSKD